MRPSDSRFSLFLLHTWSFQFGDDAFGMLQHRTAPCRSTDPETSVYIYSIMYDIYLYLSISVMIGHLQAGSGRAGETCAVAMFEGECSRFLYAYDLLREENRL